ncbi:MAG: uracil-DNA glycosylase [Gammaproteobacteria bacterium]|nr:uracil-DNA glycosylase [Gammaproteobacteria bacterium]
MTQSAEEQRLYLQAMGIPVWEVRQPHLLQNLPVADAVVVESERESDVESPLAEAVVEPPTVLNWPDLQQQVSNCTTCAARQGRMQPILGAGSEQADLLIVGEMPNADEDRLAAPFVSASGQLLEGMLKAIGLSRQAVYLTHIVKCHLEEHRDPTPEELSACQGFLLQQIKLVQPKAILLLGRIAAHACLQVNTPLTQLRGEWFEFAATPLLVSYHPAYLLRKPSAKRLAWQDLKLLRARLQGE